MNTAEIRLSFVDTTNEEEVAGLCYAFLNSGFFCPELTFCNPFNEWEYGLCITEKESHMPFSVFRNRYPFKNGIQGHLNIDNCGLDRIGIVFNREANNIRLIAFTQKAAGQINRLANRLQINYYRAMAQIS